MLVIIIMEFTLLATTPPTNFEGVLQLHSSGLTALDLLDEVDAETYGIDYDVQGTGIEIYKTTLDIITSSHTTSNNTSSS